MKKIFNAPRKYILSNFLLLSSMLMLWVGGASCQDINSWESFEGEQLTVCCERMTSQDKDFVDYSLKSENIERKTFTLSYRFDADEPWKPIPWDSKELYLMEIKDLVIPFHPEARVLFLQFRSFISEDPFFHLLEKELYSQKVEIHYQVQHKLISPKVGGLTEIYKVTKVVLGSSCAQEEATIFRKSQIKKPIPTKDPTDTPLALQKRTIPKKEKDPALVVLYF